MRPLLRVLPVLAIVPMLSGCGVLSARGKPPELPPMNVPPAPERVIEPAPEPLPEPVADLPPTPSSSTALRPRPPATRPAPQQENKPAEPKAVEPPPQDPAPVPQPPPAPAAQLRTPQTADGNNAEKTIRTKLGNARSLLSSVDYQALNTARKKAYDDSNGFIKDAEEKLKEGNFVYAEAMAVKAENLAKELAGK